MLSLPFCASVRPRCTQLALLLALFLLVSGCGRFRPRPRTETVYVIAKDTFLRDRVAAVSNRVAEVKNGDALTVNEHARRFLKVRTAAGGEGWIEEHSVINQAARDQFTKLAEEHGKDPVVATGVVRDDLYLHAAPGRNTDRFYLLPEADKLQLLKRTSVPRPDTAQAAPAPKPVAVAGRKSAGRKNETEPEPPQGPPMEDWWLVRDGLGRTGWLLSRRVDVDVPDAIAGYAEGQRIVGAYVLARVNDPESNFADHQAPEYLAVLNPYKDGLPYDFSQVRVFTWNVKKHRYEGAFRERNIEGYLPVKVDSTGPVPVFSFKVMTDGQAAIQSYRLEGAMVKRADPPKATARTVSPTEGAQPARVRRRRSGKRRHR